MNRPGVSQVPKAFATAKAQASMYQNSKNCSGEKAPGHHWSRQNYFSLVAIVVESPSQAS